MNEFREALDTLHRESRAKNPRDKNDNIYESAVSLGIQMTQESDEFRWQTGELGLIVKGRYGEDAIGKFAADIKRRKRTTYEYVQVREFYHDDSARRALLEHHENLVYSHFRTAMTLGIALAKQRGVNAYDTALAFLEECADSDWGADEADAEAKERKGKKGGPETIFDAEACLVEVKAAKNKPTRLIFEIPDWVDISALRDQAGSSFKLKIVEPSEG